MVGTSTANTIFTTFTGYFSDYITDLLPTILLFGVGIWGISFVVRKAWGYMRGL